MARLIVLFFSIILYFQTIPIKANIVRVPSDHISIQSAIDSASDGDTVVVDPGRYYENIRFRGKKIVLSSRFYENGDMNFVTTTIIDGSAPSNSDTASCVLFINHEDSTSVIQGFTITGGKGTKWVDEHGAGTYREGGGILSALSSPTIRYNLIVNNEASSTSGVSGAGGGGIRSGDGNPKILNNIILNNNGRYGAGIVLNYTGAIVRNNIVAGSIGGQSYGGGAIWMNHDGSTQKFIENNTIANNHVTGVYVYQGASIIRNCIIWGNGTTQIGVRAGGPTVTYSDVGGGYPGTGNIDSDPQFLDTLTYYLSAGSACIDSGDIASIFNDPEDPDNLTYAKLPSLGGLRNDMGAYGGPLSSMLAYPPSTGVEDGPRHLSPVRSYLNQNYPNPFNPSTVISYSVAAHSRVVIKVMDILGREVKTLTDGYRDVGEYSVEFSGSGLSSGFYLIRFQAGEYKDVKKCLLVK
jgi:hypothetical protein